MTDYASLEASTTNFLICKKCGKACDPLSSEGAGGFPTPQGEGLSNREATASVPSVQTTPSGEETPTSVSTPSPDDQNISGLVRELQEERLHICRSTDVFRDYKGDIERSNKYNQHVVWNFPAIATHLLQQEEQVKALNENFQSMEKTNGSLTDKIGGLEERLRIATDALEKISAGEVCCQDDTIATSCEWVADEALKALRSPFPPKP